MSTLPHTRTAVLIGYCIEGIFYFVVGVEAYFIHEAIKSPAVEACFHLREDCLDWIELRAVSNVEHWSDVQSWINCSDRL